MNSILNPISAAPVEALAEQPNVADPQQAIEAQVNAYSAMGAAEKKRWTGIRKIARAFALTAVGEHRKSFNAEKIADSVVDSVRLSHMVAPDGSDEVLLTFIQEQVKARVEKRIEEVVPIIAPTTNPKRIAQKQRKKALKAAQAPITVSMNVKDVIENLPTIALLISRLNDLLSPIAKPE